MTNRSSLGVLGLVTVAVLALIFGALGGYVAGKNATPSTTIIRQTAASTGTSNNPVSSAASIDSTAPMSWVQVAHEAGPAVVTVVNQLKPQQGLFGYAPAGTGEGSGFVIDHKGDIVTNNHVVDQAQSLQVVFANGKKANAQLVRADPQSDLAVVHVSVPVTTILRFGDSNMLQPGQPVMAIGSALGQYRNTVTAGVVSALGRTIQEPPSSNLSAGVSLHNMLQTDTAINQGNSGGPLLNDRGEVVGVNTLISRGAQQTDIFGAGSSVVAEGLGFAIPSSTVSNVAARLVQNKPTAFLGVQYHQINQQEATYYNLPIGAYINTIRPNSPASRAGLHQRDIVTKINGQPINDTYSLEQVVAEHTPGQTVAVTMWRSGKTLARKVKLGATP